MTGPVRATSVEELRPHLLALYEEVYSASPWHETAEDVLAFSARLDVHALRKGFRCEMVWDRGRLVGACYGYDGPLTALPDTPFYAALATGLGEAGVREHLLGSTCEIAELLVSESARGRGLGASLLAARLAGERRGWLCRQPDAGALAFYLARGWTPRGEALLQSGLRVLVCTWVAAPGRSGEHPLPQNGG